MYEFMVKNTVQIFVTALCLCPFWIPIFYMGYTQCCQVSKSWRPYDVIKKFVFIVQIPYNFFFLDFGNLLIYNGNNRTIEVPYLGQVGYLGAQLSFLFFIVATRYTGHNHFWNHDSRFHKNLQTKQHFFWLLNTI